MCCLGRPLLQLVQQPEEGRRVAFKKTRSMGNSHLLHPGARVGNIACSSWLPSQGQGPQIPMYCLKPSFHKPTG